MKTVDTILIIASVLLLARFVLALATQAWYSRQITDVEAAAGCVNFHQIAQRAHPWWVKVEEWLRKRGI